MLRERNIFYFFALFLLLNVFQFLNPQPAWCEVFEYKYNKGDRYRILSVVNEEVLFNRVLNHRAEILNRIAVEVIDVKENKGQLKATFQTSERSLYVNPARRAQNTQTVFQWSREYESFFERDRLGYITIDPVYFMPVVRNVPVFPGRNLNAGDEWNADGYEIHDFRDSFGIVDPYRIPFTAYYNILGDRQWKGKTYPAFSVSYRIISKPQAVRGQVWPVSIAGAFNQIVYWDHKRGNPAAYEETFNLVFELSNGMTVEFRGSASAEIIESEYMDRDKITSEITEEIEQLKIPDIVVKAVDKGVSITLEDIGFYPDSAVMLPGELEKLEKIAEILMRYPDRDIEVNGHTALAGTRDARMKLSIDRANAVTDYLLSRNVRSPDRIVSRGFGADMPVSDNSTEEGRRRNRRVEITILGN